jgi:predicted ATPase
MKSGQSGAVEGRGQRTVRERKTIIIRKRERKQDQTLPSDDLRARVAARAYSFYERRGYEDGYDLEDWLEAERSILAE